MEGFFRRVLRMRRMSLSYLRYQLLSFVGYIATTYPEAWVLSWAFLGMATGMAIYGFLGYWLGTIFQQSMIGLWCGAGLYAYQVAEKAELVNARIDVMVDTLRQSARNDQDIPF